jgi:Fibronectin type III-like domain
MSIFCTTRCAVRGLRSSRAHEMDGRDDATAVARDGARHDETLRYEVAFDVTNTGHRDGADVSEAYVGEAQTSVPRPERELKGFARVNLRAGETKRVKAVLDSRAFAFFDTAAHEWRVDPGEFTVSVGRSVNDILSYQKHTLLRSENEFPPPLHPVAQVQPERPDVRTIHASVGTVASATLPTDSSALRFALHSRTWSWLVRFVPESDLTAPD